MPDQTAHFDIFAIAKSFPEEADTLLLDRYLTDEPHASTRVFRVYRPTPAHYHRESDEQLYVVSGRGAFWMESESNGMSFAPGTFLHFKRNTVHAMPRIDEHPVVFLAIDTPRRNPGDIHFVDAGSGTPESFIRQADSGQSPET